MSLERRLHPYPMVRLMHRLPEPGGPRTAYVWDIDKTYLDTHFSSLGGLAWIPFEFGVDKRAVPGTVPLLHRLRRGRDGRAFHPLYFVTASPHQIRGSLARKMLLDGVEFDGIIFKDWGAVLRRGGPRRLKEHLAFKLAALMVLAADMPAEISLHLFGDDAEADPLAYTLFAEVSAGTLRGADLRARLGDHGVRRATIEPLVEAAAQLPLIDRVAGIHIRLVRFPDGARIREYGDRVIGWPDATVLARTLAAAGLIPDAP
ncbi:MAG: phosphatase domain-containing protein [Pseudomonadota bacterium]